MTVIASFWIGALEAGPDAHAGTRLDRFYAGMARYIDNTTKGSDGRVWFTYDQGVGAVNADGRVMLHPLPGGVELFGLTAGPDGALWMTDAPGNVVLRRTANGALTTFRGLSPASYPGAITTGPDGNLWFTIEGGLARITPSGDVTEYRRLPEDTRAWVLTSGPDGALWFGWDRGVGRMTTDGDVRLWALARSDVNVESIALGPDGNLWIAGIYYRDLLRMTPGGRFKRIRAGEQVSDVIAGPDGNLWFSYYYGVGRLAPSGRSLVRWPEPFGGRTNCDPYEGLGPDGGLAFDATGRLWAASGSMRSLVRVSRGPAQRSPLEPFLRRQGALADPDSIARGWNGRVWISAPRAIVRVDARGRRKVFRRGVGQSPGDLLPAADGSVWYTAGRGLNRLRPDGRVRRYRHGFSKRSYLSSLTRGPDGNIWFVDRGRRAIGRITAAGRVREFSHALPRRADLRAIATARRYLWVTDSSGGIIRVSTSGRLRRFTDGLGRKADPTGITRGADGAMWFTEFRAHRIARITSRGRISEYRVHENPVAITPGPDGAVWFTTTAADAIDTTAGVGRITLDGRVDQFYVHKTCSGSVRGLIRGPDGKLWFIEPDGPIAVGRLSPHRLRATGALPPANIGMR